MLYGRAAGHMGCQGQNLRDKFQLHATVTGSGLPYADSDSGPGRPVTKPKSLHQQGHVNQRALESWRNVLIKCL